MTTTKTKKQDTSSTELITGPIPERKRKKGTTSDRYGLNGLPIVVDINAIDAIGTLVKGVPTQRVMSTISWVSRRTGHRFITRTMEEGLGVWRVA